MLVSKARHFYRFGSLPLDINLFREESGIKKLKQSTKSRFRNESLVDQVVSLDKEYRESLYGYETGRKLINIKNRLLGQMYKNHMVEGRAQILKEVEDLKKANEKLNKSVQDIDQKISKAVAKIGNVIDCQVQVHRDQDFNRVCEVWGKPSKLTVPYWEILEKKLDAIDMKRGSKVTGHRGYFLKGVGVRLTQALTQFGMNFLQNQGYTLYQTPVTIKQELMRACCQLSSIQEDVYKLENQGLMLIATSEQALASLYASEVLENDLLPLNIGGYSLCFRKEAGAAGKDNQGIFRVHQFEKLEQFVICRQEQSQAMQEKMLKVSKKFYQSLQIPYRVVQIVSGALNDAAISKFDIEGWFPATQKYRQLVSVSNCTDYQSRMLDIKYRTNEGTRYVHMLNGTLCAIERTLCALVENHHTETGIRLPKALVKYYGSELIPFKN